MPLVASLGPGGEKGRRPENRAFYVVKELPTFRGVELQCLWLPLSAPFPSRVEAHPPLPHISETFLLTWPQAAVMSAHSRHGTNLHHQHARLQIGTETHVIHSCTMNSIAARHV